VIQGDKRLSVVHGGRDIVGRRSDNNDDLAGGRSVLPGDQADGALREYEKKKKKKKKREKRKGKKKRAKDLRWPSTSNRGPSSTEDNDAGISKVGESPRRVIRHGRHRSTIVAGFANEASPSLPLFTLAFSATLCPPAHLPTVPGALSFSTARFYARHVCSEKNCSRALCPVLGSARSAPLPLPGSLRPAPPPPASSSSSSSSSPSPSRESESRVMNLIVR